MSIENEEDVQEEEKEASNEPVAKVSRARNRTVMLTPEMTGQVRSAIREETKEPVDSDFSRPNSIHKPREHKAEPKAQMPSETAESLQQSNLGLKFGKSVNRSRTTKFSREEVESASKLAPAKAAPVKQEPADGYTLPTPVVPKTFDPLTSVVPPNHGSGKMSDSGPPRSAPRVEPRLPQTQAPQMQAAVVRGQALKGTTKIVGFLVSFDNDQNGEVYEIRAGRKLITSRPTDHGEYLLIEDSTVSPLHAILRTTKEGRLQVLDQLSEHGTGITKSGEGEEIEVAGGLELVENGDILRFGERRFLVSLLPVVAAK